MDYASKDYSNSLGYLSSLLIIISPRRAGAFSRDFTKNLAPQLGAFTRALKFKKLIALLFPGPRRGAMDSNDCCINTKSKTKSYFASSNYFDTALEEKSFGTVKIINCIGLHLFFKA